MFYDKLATLFGKDRATGYDEDAGFEMRAKKAASAKKNYGPTIEDIDHLVETNEVTLEGFEVDEEFDPNGSPKRPSIRKPQDVPSSRNKKRARKVDEDETSMSEIAKTFKKMAEMFELNTAELVKQNKSSSAEDVWANLVEIGVEEASLPCVYMHLVQHPEALKAFNGIPVDKRKEMLPYIVPNYP